MGAEVLPFERPEDPPEDRPVLVVDFGGQYSQLIARRVRECRVYSELVSHRTPAQALRARNPRAIDPQRRAGVGVRGRGARRSIRGVWELGIPMLGICYGMQLMARDLGGEVARTGGSEFGRADLRADGGALFEDTPEEQLVWMSHRDSVTAPPEGAEVTASSPSTPIAAFEAPERGLYGVQFHPEVVHTPHGQEVLKNFLYGVAEAPPTWTAAAVIEEQVERIRAQVGSERVLCALSGGVDSAVAALLVHKAVGDQLTCVFVDHGLLRKDEAAQVVETFQGHFKVPLVHVDAEERFLARLEGVDDPEEKRKRVGEEFIRVFEDEATALGADPLPRPGHALLGRDRVRRDGRRRGDDQVAPQRRRPPRGRRLRARRAAAAALQGRGAPRRRGARPAGTDGLAPAVPRARASRSASSARSRESGWRSCARRTRSSRRRCGVPGSTASSGSPSPCCRRSARWASRATSGPTRTRS